MTCWGSICVLCTKLFTHMYLLHLYLVVLLGSFNMLRHWSLKVPEYQLLHALGKICDQILLAKRPYSLMGTLVHQKCLFVWGKHYFVTLSSYNLRWLPILVDFCCFSKDFSVILSQKIKIWANYSRVLGQVLRLEFFFSIANWLILWHFVGIWMCFSQNEWIWSELIASWADWLWF